MTADEIELIYKVDVKEKMYLDRVRDLFIVACYTGLRFSDLMQVRAENIINESSQIKIRTEKTNELIVIPLHKYVKEIIKKYDGSLPPVISNQKMNDYLKQIGKKAKLLKTMAHDIEEIICRYSILFNSVMH